MVTVYPGFNFLVNHLCVGQDNRIENVLPSVPDASRLDDLDV